MATKRYGRKLRLAMGASAALHVSALSILATTVLPTLQQHWIDVEQTSFAGQPVAIAVRFATPERPLPPLPEPPAVDATVVVRPHEAHIADHVYVDKATSEVAAPALETPVVELPREVDRPLPIEHAVAEAPAPAQDSSKTDASPAEVSPLAKRAPHLLPSTASVAVPPQTLGTRPDVAARLHNNRPPRFPDIARQNRWYGTVLLKLTINAQGRVTQVEVIESSGYAILDAEATAAVRIWTGDPAQRAGVAVASEVLLPIRFRP